MNRVATDSGTLVDQELREEELKIKAQYSTDKQEIIELFNHVGFEIQEAIKRTRSYYDSRETWAPKIPHTKIHETLHNIKTNNKKLIKQIAKKELIELKIEYYKTLSNKCKQFKSNNKRLDKLTQELETDEELDTTDIDN